MAAQLNKEASTFVPKWLLPAATPAPAAAVAPTVAPAAPANGAAPTATKLNSTAPVFIPKARVVAPVEPSAPAPAETKPTAAPAAQQQQVNSKPTVDATALGQAKTAAPTGQWAKGAPKPVVTAAATVSPAAKPAAAATVSPALKPRTPGTGPAAAPGAIYKSPAARPAAPPVVVPPTKLNQTAKEFRPKFLPVASGGVATPPVTPPVQPRPQPASDLPPMAESSMPLNNLWSLFYIDRAVQGTDHFDPTLVYEMRSIEDFWRTFNNIPTLTRSDLGSTYFMFRDQIKPLWEDAANKQGGSWTIRLVPSLELDADAIDAVWETILCRCVGSSWWTQHQNTVTGIVAKIRDRGFTLQFWVNQRMDDFPQDVASCIAKFYPAFKMDYVSHQAAYDAATERDKEKNAEKKKNKKQRY